MMQEEKTMKKSSLGTIFIIIAFVAMIATSSILDGIGFAISLFLGIGSLICIILAICMFIVFILEIIEKKIDAVFYLMLAVVLAFLGIKILKWLIGVLI